MPQAIPLHQVDEVASTSDVLAARAAQGHGECALLARRQTSGRGRLGRSWATLDGNLFLSILLRPGTPLTPGPWSLLAAVALADALDQCLPQPGLLRLKWPNDVLLNGAKVAGILLDAGTSEGNDPWLVIGFGVNLAAAPAGLGRPVACVAHVTPPPPPQAFALSLLGMVSHWRSSLAREGAAPISNAWLARGPAPGDPITAGTGPSRTEGTFHGLAPDGALLIRTASSLVAVHSGEVN